MKTYEDYISNITFRLCGVENIELGLLQCI